MQIFEVDKLVDARQYQQKRCKATIQRSGKLGFSANAAEYMALRPNARLLVSECGDGDLAAVVCDDERGFPVRKAAKYFSVNMKAFFDQRNVDYRDAKHVIAYDIVKLNESFEGHPVFKLTRRVITRRVSKEDAMPA